MGIFNFSTLRKSLQDFSAQVHSLRADIERLQRQREDVLSAPAAKADVKAIFNDWFVQREKDFTEMWSGHLTGVFRKPGNFKDPARAAQHLAVFAVQRNANNGADLKSMDIALCALFGAALKPQLWKMIDAVDLPNEGLPLAERARKIEDLDAQLDRLKAEEAELVQAAAQARIVID